MKKLIISFAVMLTSITTIIAQDAEGCNEHPFFSRMPNFYISDCSQKFDKLDYYDSNGEIASQEGESTIIYYKFPEDESLKVPSPWQVYKNYENAIIKLGGKKVYVDGENKSSTFTLKKNSKEYIICLEIHRTVVADINHDLYVLEIAQMVQEITANEMLDALNKDGYIALNILFETGKSSIEQESLPIVDQIYELMKSNSSLKVSVEGHTDNVGDAASNKKLSNDRAKAIMDALIAKGIDKTKLSSIGWGQEKPVGDNRTDDGRTRNRRVEIVRIP